MSRERKQRRRRERQRRRGPPGPVGSVRLPGVMGWFQSNPRLFYVGGIAVMVLSLGAVFFGTQFGAQVPPVPDDDRDEQTQATPQPSATVEGSPTAEPIVRVYDSQPPMEIDPTHRFEAVIYTEKGTIRLELLPQDAPGYVNNFVFLARNRFYDDLTFHRVIPGFVAQGGDPIGTGAGGPGYNLVEETNSINFDAGVISMAKGATVSGSQFFITLDPAPHLNDGFAVFGRVIEGMDVLRALTARDPSQPNQPEPDRILRIEIIEDGAS